MRDDHESKGGGFFKGLVVGGLVGTVMALLFAPKSGKETQEDIKRKARGMKHDLDALIDQMQQDLVGRIDDLKVVAKDLQGEARVESQDLVRRAELLKSDLTKSASNLQRMGGEAKDEVVTNAKHLLSEGSSIMTEMERVTKKMMSSAKEKMKHEADKDNQIEI